MYKFCVFAGTTEGRELVEFLAGQEDVSVTACVATDYGEALLPPAENLTVSARRMTAEEMADLLAGEKFDLVVDATHPYAREVTENIAAACEKTGTPYLRLLRDAEETAGDAVFVPDIPAAVAYLDQTDGNILLTTGSKEILLYSNMRDSRTGPTPGSCLWRSPSGPVGRRGWPPATSLPCRGPFPGK